VDNGRHRTLGSATLPHRGTRQRRVRVGRGTGCGAGPGGCGASPLAVETLGLEAVGDAAQAEAEAGLGCTLGDAGEAGDLAEGPAFEVGEQDGGALRGRQLLDGDPDPFGTAAATAASSGLGGGAGSRAMAARVA
jgi:hypothetical protein